VIGRCAPIAAALLSTLCLLWAAPAWATPDEDLKDAAQAYDRGDYGRVIKLLDPLLRPKIRFARQTQAKLAYKLLGISYVMTKKRAEAEKQFLDILSQDPRFQLDPLVYPQAAVQVFDDVRRRNAEKIKAILERERQEAERRRQEKLRQEAERRRLERLAQEAGTVIERTVVERPYWLNFIPLGVGQFQNGHKIKGWILLTTQLALAGVSLGAFIGSEYGLPARQLTPDELVQAETLMLVQVISASLCAALMTYGVIDALFYYKPRTVNVRTYQRKPKIPTKKSAAIWSLVPSAHDGGAGLQLGITF
jgi:tetratricopeptide (TPR) repeat protein